MPVTRSDEKLIHYIAPVGVRTHHLPHTVASNMVKVSHAFTHSATVAVTAWTEHSNHNNQHIFSNVCTDRIHMVYYSKIAVLV